MGVRGCFGPGCYQAGEGEEDENGLVAEVC